MTRVNASEIGDGSVNKVHTPHVRERRMSRPTPHNCRVRKTIFTHDRVECEHEEKQPQLRWKEIIKAMVIIDEMLNYVQCDKETLQRGKKDKNTTNLSKYSLCMQ